jgi:Ser/Thr protein kinase RdoA (MazF antagonist)
LIEKALEKYNFKSPKATLIRHNENITYKVDDVNKSYVLRIHDPIEGINLEILRFKHNRIDLVSGEITLLQYLSKNEHLHTQTVKFNKDNKPITTIEENIPVTVLEWIEGITLEDIEITSKVAYQLGVMIGNLHNRLIQYKSNQFTNRYVYGGVLFDKMITEAFIASKQGHFNDFCAKIIIETLEYIKTHMLNARSRYMIIHSDLGKSNIISSAENFIPIDFSLSGYCIPEMDIASIFSHINNVYLNDDILEGYKSISEIHLSNDYINTCFCLQILLFIIIQHNKVANETWFQEKLNDWCEQYFIPLLTNEI